MFTDWCKEIYVESCQIKKRYNALKELVKPEYITKTHCKTKPKLNNMIVRKNLNVTEKTKVNRILLTIHKYIFCNK